MKRQTSSVTDSRQSGFVAIFSVIFFTLLSMVITIGFIRIVNVEQQQALNNDLTARALAAAEAGVEDAKRAIAHYASLRDDDPDRDDFREALTGSECDTLFRSGSAVEQTLGLDNRGQVAGDQNLFYTCLNVDLDTPNYIKTLARDENHVIPLRANGDYDRVTLEWHMNSDQDDENGDGVPSNYHPAGSLPTISNFGSQGSQPPAYIRAQLIGLPKDSFTRSDLADRGRTVFLAPFTSGGTQLDMETADPRGFNSNKSSPFQVDCQSTEEAQASGGGYACRAVMTMPSGERSPENNNYFLQLTPIYRDTRISLRLADGNDDRAFDAVQPKIDSTGKAADVFRRVEVRVAMPDVQYDMPRYGVEVGDNICKQFEVTGSPSGFVNPISNLSKCTGTVGAPICEPTNDIMMILDTSASLDTVWESMRAIDKLEQAAQSFVDGAGLSATTNNAGAVLFNSNTSLVQQLTNNGTNLKGALNNLQSEGETFYVPALDAAFAELQTSRAREDAPKVVVFVSDGAPNDVTNAIRAKANELKSQGVRIYTIGIDGSTFESPVDRFDEQLLIDMAGNGGTYSEATSEAELNTRFDDIAGELSC